MDAITRNRIQKYSYLVLLLAISLLLLLLPHVQKLFPHLRLDQILGMGFGVIACLFWYFDSRLSTLSAGTKPILANLDLAECFHDVASKCTHFTNIRIYALSTGRIQPLFASSGIHADRCTIMIRGFRGEELEGTNIEYKSHIEDMIREWEELRRAGRIKKLEIVRYYFLPTEYQVVFDDQFVISGLFKPTTRNWSSVEVGGAILIGHDSVNGARYIKTHIDRFDGFVQTMRSIGSDNVRG